MLDITHFFIASAFAQTPPSAPAESPASSFGSIGMNFLPLLLIFGVFYLLLIRPQQKKLDEQARMIKSLKRGDRIVTAGGIHGKIVKILDDAEHFMVEIAEGIHVKVVRSTVTALAAKTEPATAKPDEPPAGDDGRKD